MTQTSQPFDDIRDLVAKVDKPDIEPGVALRTFYANNRIGTLQPLGQTQEALMTLANVQGRTDPRIMRPLIAVFSGSHDIAKTLFDLDDVVPASKARVAMLTEGAAGVRGIASSHQAAFKVFEMGIEYPAADMTLEGSLSERDCAAAIAFGMEVVAEGADLIVLGNAGLGSATAAAAIARGLYGGASSYWAGGTGEVSKRRVDAVEKAVSLHADHLDDPLQCLRWFGGRDVAGMVGAILACAHQKIPVILDGYVVCAAAAVLHAIDEKAVSHCIAGHISQEPAHGALLDRMGLTPVMDLQIGIGDGTGGAIAMGVLRAMAEANAIYQEA